eukprot:NODE_531_length_7106_cov_0.213929.p1 type:complete len:628 gc:universal NODE_531_length_7106_cov_0.213929:2820-4703(+)
MSFPVILPSSQFQGEDFELHKKLKYHGQKKAAIIKEYPMGGNSKVKFETVNDNHFVQFYYDDKFYELNVTHLHGSIFSVLHNDSHIIYLAEVKKPKVPWHSAEFGERFKNKRYPVLVVIDLKVAVANYFDCYKSDGKPEDIKGISCLDLFDKGYIPWYFSITENSILFTGLYHSPILLGVVYCPNRPSDIFQIPFSLEIDSLKMLTDSKWAVRSPMYSPSSDSIFYLRNPLMGPHFTNCQIMQIKDSNHKVLVDTFSYKSYQSPSISYKPEILSYAGIYCDAFHVQSIFKDYIIMDTNCQSRQIIVVINSVSTSVTTISDPLKSFYFYGHNSTVAVINSTSMEHGITVKSVDLRSLLSGKLVDVHVYYRQSGFGTISIRSLSPSMDIIIMKPHNCNNKIVYMPHGGPHSAYTTAYSNNLHLFLLANYTIVLINYTGSVGYGINNVNELVGKIGILDIEECYTVVSLLHQEEFKGFKKYITGGSHGGFIASHMVGKYPNLFKACVMRNPVISLPLNVSSDIMDWAFNEMGLALEQSSPRFPTPKEYELMYNQSSDRLCKNVTTPTLVMIGKDDLRVPPFQGLRWVQIVNSYNNVAKAIIYADNGHSLDLYEADQYGHDELIKWFEENE